MWVLTENDKVVTIKNNDPEAAVKSVRFCADDHSINLILHINNPKSLNFVSDMREAAFENCATEMPGYRIKIDNWHQLFIVKAHPVDFAAQRDLIVSRFAIPLDRLLMCAKHVADKTQPCCTRPSINDLQNELLVGADGAFDKEKIRAAAAVGYYIDHKGFKWLIQILHADESPNPMYFNSQGTDASNNHYLDSDSSKRWVRLFSHKLTRISNKWQHSVDDSLSYYFTFDAHKYTFTWQQNFNDHCDEMRYVHEKQTKSPAKAFKFKPA